MNILIVDDNPDISEALGEILNINGYKSVKTAKSAKEALDTLNQWEAHIVISDLLMPKVNGFELYEEVMKFPSPPKFILITGADVEELDYQNDNKLTILQKPFSSHLLVALINSLKHKFYRQPASPSQPSPKDFPNVS